MKEKAKKPFYKRWWFFVIAGMFVLGLILQALGFDEESEADIQEKERIQAENRAKRDEIKAEKEKKEREEKEAYEKMPFYQQLVKENDYIDAADFVNGKLTIKKEIKTYFSDTQTMKNDVYEIFEVMEKGFEEKRVNEVEAILSATLYDEKGHESVGEIVKYRYFRETFDSLDVSNFKFLSYSDTWRILNQADHYWIRPGIYEGIEVTYKNQLNSGAIK